MRRTFTSFLLLLVTLALLAGGAAFWWLHQPLTLRMPPGITALDLEIEPGNANQAAAAVVASGADVPVRALQWWFRLSGQARLIKAGSYEITPGSTPRSVLKMLVRGDQTLRSVTLVEGWTFAQVRAAR